MSSDPELRLSACEMVQSLLSPLQWVQVYVPSVPDPWPKWPHPRPQPTRRPPTAPGAQPAGPGLPSWPEASALAAWMPWRGCFMACAPTHFSLLTAHFSLLTARYQVPDAWLELLSTPFPCLIGLSPAQARHLPTNLPTRMALLQLDSGHLGEPRERPPPLPSREAGPLQAAV